MTKIAIADDEHLFSQLIQAFLNEQNNIQCLFTAQNGTELIEKMTNHKGRIDLVILDLKMGTPDGAETNILLKEKFPHVKTIIMSSYYDQSFIGYIMRVGANAFVPKTITPNDLIKVIQTICVHDCYFTKEQLKIMRHQISSQAPKPKLIAIEKFSSREKEVLTLICQQFTAQEIADKLFISKRTVDGHKNNLFSKTGARNVAGLVIYAIQHQLISKADLPLFH